MTSSVPVRDRSFGVARSLGAAVGAALALLLLASVQQLTASPVPLVLLLGLAGLAAWRADLALVVLAAGCPLASWAARQWAPNAAWAEALVVAFAAGWFLRRVVPRAPERDPLDPPVRIVTLIVFLSTILGLALAAWRATGDPLSLSAFTSVWREYFSAQNRPHPVDTGMRLLESLLLFRAASLIAAARPDWGPRAATALAAGAAAAGALNIWSLWQAAQRAESPMSAFLAYVSAVRVNIHFGDINAAGSYFATALAVAAGFAWTRGSRTWAGAAAVAMTAALWGTGSRTAMAALVVAAALPAVFRPGITRVAYARIAFAAGVALLVAAAAAAYLLPHRGNQRSAADAIRVRWELTLTSLRMTAVAPVFGVGLGNYYALSGQFSSPELLQLFPPARNENAHNNYLQILAELGAAGFGAFAWLVLAAARRASHLVRSDRTDPRRWGIVCGLVAFALTCLGGHPLLTDVPAFSFWLLLGAAAGWGLSTAPPSPAIPARSPARLVSTVLVILVLAAIPWRWQAERMRLDMEHLGFGLSAWQPDIDGVRYRVAGRASTVFVPSDARSVTIPLRATAPHGELDVALRLDGHPANVVRVYADRWHMLRLIVPPASGGPRFRRLDLEVTGPSSPGAPVLMIGKVTPS